MTTSTDDIEALVDDEWYAVRYSGEIPEVAYHGAVFHLTEALNGPRVELSRRQHERLLEAVTQRYLEITTRDLLPENKMTGGYRGLKRSYINWKRFMVFCERFDIEGAVHKEKIGVALADFLNHEATLVIANKIDDELNCSYAELIEFTELLGLGPTIIPEAVKNYFLGC